MELALRILLFVASLFGFIYGAFHYFRKAALFNQLIVFAEGCFLIGQLYDGIIHAVTHTPVTDWSLSDLATLGCFMFILSASYGQMDGLVDGRGRELRKYRFIALLAPLTIAVTFGIFIIVNRDFKSILLNCFIYAVIAAASYFNLKHLIIPDIDFGILKSIRGYNFISLLLCILFAIRQIEEKGTRDVVWSICTILISICWITILPVLRRGSKKWIL